MVSRAARPAELPAANRRSRPLAERVDDRADRRLLGGAHGLVALAVRSGDMFGKRDDEALVLLELLRRALRSDQRNRVADVPQRALGELLRRVVARVVDLGVRADDRVEQLAVPMLGARFGVGLGHRDRLAPEAAALRGDHEQARRGRTLEDLLPLLRREVLLTSHLDRTFPWGFYATPESETSRLHALALMVRRIANSTREHPTAATRRPSGRRPVQVSGVLSRPGKTHSPGTYVVSGDLCRWQAGWASAHPAAATHEATTPGVAPPEANSAPAPPGSALRPGGPPGRASRAPRARTRTGPRAQPHRRSRSLPAAISRADRRAASTRPKRPQPAAPRRRRCAP